MITSIEKSVGAIPYTDSKYGWDSLKFTSSLPEKWRGADVEHIIDVLMRVLENPR